MIDDEIQQAAEKSPEEQPNYATGLAWTMGFNALVKVVVGVVGIYIARTLPNNILGIFGVLGNIYIFAEQMREAGLRQAFYNDTQVTPERYRTYARLSVTSGITFGAILAALSYPLASFFGQPQLIWSIIWAAIATCVNGFTVVSLASLHKSGRFRDVGIIETTANFAAAGVALGMVLLGYGLEALVAQLVVRSFVLFGLSFWQRPYSILNIDKAAAKQIMRVCTPLVATDVLWLFYSLADQFTIIKLLGVRFGQTFATNSNAFYAQGRKLINIPGDFVFTPINRTVAVAIGNRSGDPAELARTFMKAISLAVITLGAILGCFAALREPIILAVYTSKLAGAIPVFGIICLSDAFKLTGTFAGSALVAAGKSKIPLFAWILPYPVMAAGIGLTWQHVSLESIAWSYAAGMVAVNIVVTAAGFVYLGVKREQVKRFWMAVGCVLLITGIAYGLSLLPLRPWPHVLVAAAVLPPLYAVIIGIVLARKPFAFLSRSGPSRLREAL